MASCLICGDESRLTTVGQRKGYVSLREAQMRLGQDMADAIDYASEAA